MSPDPIHRRRLVLHGALKTISEQLHGVDPRLTPTELQQAWKTYFAGLFWPGQSSEDVIRRPDWHDTLLRIEAWAAERGVTFTEGAT